MPNLDTNSVGEQDADTDAVGEQDSNGDSDAVEVRNAYAYADNHGNGTPSGSTTSPVAVPTAVPAGTDGGVGSGAAGLAGLGVAVIGTAAGAAMIGRRRFRHEI